MNKEVDQTMPKNISVILLGLGNIGYQIDKSAPAGVAVSHYRSFYNSTDFVVVAGVEPNDQVRREFESKTNIPCFKGVEEVHGIQAQLAVIATSPAERSQVVSTVLRYLRPTVILCEKPLALTEKECREIVSMCERDNVQLYVNYFRRALPELKEFKTALALGDLGEVRKCCVWYSKGVLNSASHFLDLLIWFLGSSSVCGPFKISGKDKQISNEGDFYVELGGVPCYFLKAFEEDFFHNTVEILTTKARVRLDSACRTIDISHASGTDLNGLKSLTDESEVVRLEWDKTQEAVVNELRHFFNGHNSDLSSGYESLLVHSLLFEVI